MVHLDDAMEMRLKKLEVVFYSTETGIEPVRDWLRDLPKQDRKMIGEDIEMVQYGWPLGKPLVDSLGDGLWEVRSKLSDGRIVRSLFFIHSRFMVLVNAFIKKTRKTPKSELELAKKRKRQYEYYAGVV